MESVSSKLNYPLTTYSLRTQKREKREGEKRKRCEKTTPSEKRVKDRKKSEKEHFLVCRKIILRKGRMK